MNLLHNPIADLHGTDFLTFYGIVIIVTYIVCALLRRLSDRTASLPVPVLPAQPDAYEIAYLRDGESEVARVTVFNLLQRGFLQVTPDAKNIEQAPSYQNVRALAPMEQYTFTWFATPRSAKEIFQNSSSLQGIRPFCEYYRKYLDEEQMLTSVGLRRTSWLLWLVGAMIIASLGVYKLQVAAATGHSNVGYMTIMLIVAPLLLLAICRAPRLSARGKAYLKQLQLAFGSVKEQIKGVNDANMVNAYLVAVGLFGVGMLAGTQYSYFQKMYTSVTSSSSSGGGGGCGGGGCGGGGCGGA
jgi:uncharacterized protein (TIGR04222 family)